MSRKQTATVILVDDDPLVREVGVRLLGEAGYSVQPFESGQAALDLLRSGAEVDMVLSDIKMPGMSGIQLLEEIRAFDQQTPVILMTGYAEVEMAVAAIQKGVFDFILKPYNPPQLLHSVEKAIDMRRLRQIEQNYQAELEARVEQATQELQATHEKMLQGEKMASIGQLAAGVAHEINNPVGFIASNLSTLSNYVERLVAYIAAQEQALTACCPDQTRETLDQERRRLKLDHIREDIRPLLAESIEGTDRIKKLVLSLKTFSRVDDAEFIPADINAGLESTINICWNEIKYVATLNREFGELPMARVYPQQLNQVFMNLLVNAAHAIEGQGEITVKTWHDDGAIFVSIADTGCGIPESIRDKIFDPFFTTKESGKGTGLGLSIACDIVRKHRGEISLESSPGKGTTFVVRLPLHQG
ncbi:hypothetical protein DESUT3_01890 [Desulfuromonas versatilis]|uniref:histidine kinase n=1 Tax=Desulfuromonas versatilis TaxID=2802975 RepID=A0ABM8HLU8_9BACT|nr:response regulator [Desulfuromonas versatilis]BCR03120.1 hypothetical protein DESUT3_01890 [Desulfuromonas versatilis]